MEIRTFYFALSQSYVFCFLCRLRCFTYLPLEDLRLKAGKYGPNRERNNLRANEILEFKGTSILDDELWGRIIRHVVDQMNKTTGTRDEEMDLVGKIREFDRNAIRNISSATQKAEWKRNFPTTPENVFKSAKNYFAGGPFFGFRDAKCWVFRMFVCLVFFFFFDLPCYVFVQKDFMCKDIYCHHFLKKE